MSKNIKYFQIFTKRGNWAWLSAQHKKAVNSLLNLPLGWERKIGLGLFVAFLREVDDWSIFWWKVVACTVAGDDAFS